MVSASSNLTSALYASHGKCQQNKSTHLQWKPPHTWCQRECFWEWMCTEYLQFENVLSCLFRNVSTLYTYIKMSNYFFVSPEISEKTLILNIERAITSLRQSKMNLWEAPLLNLTITGVKADHYKNSIIVTFCSIVQLSCVGRLCKVCPDRLLN